MTDNTSLILGNSSHLSKPGKKEENTISTPSLSISSVGKVRLHQTAPGLERKQFRTGPARKEIEQQAITGRLQGALHAYLTQGQRHANLQAAIG